MKNIGISVKQLADYLNTEVASGHGDYKIFVTDDEEANGYHALWYLGETASQIAEGSISNLRYMEHSNHDISILEDETDKAVYMG